MVLSAAPMARASRLHLLCAALAGLGCYSTGDGPDPPVQGLYFPTAAVASPSGKALYVANSDFDLQFNGGTVQVIDLERVRTQLAPLWDPDSSGAPDVCARAGLGPNPSPIIYPGPCGPVDLAAPPDLGGPLVTNVAKVGAFATSLLYVCQPEASRPGQGARCEGQVPTRARLFATIRGDPSLTYFDVDDDREGVQRFTLDCGQGANDGRCDATHRLGMNAEDNTRGLTMPGEPYEMAVSDGAEAVVVTHQTSGAVSLFASSGDTIFDTPATIQFVLTGLPLGALGVAPLPIPALARNGANLAPTSDDVLTGGYRPGFVVGYRDASELDIIRYYSDRSSAPTRPYLSLARTAAVPILANASGFDSRGLAVDRAPREKCEADCGTDGSCLFDCTRTPLPVYVASRTPPTLLVGETRTLATSQGSGTSLGASSFNEGLVLYDAIPLALGPSRVVLGTVRDRDGELRRRVFIVCFDQRALIVYDPERRRVEAQIRTGRGPQSIVLDPVLPLGYVVHFADSYIGIVDLDQRHGLTFGTIVATLGVPQAPQESK
jgi:hypothetical protein